MWRLLLTFLQAAAWHPSAGSSREEALGDLALDPIFPPPADLWRPAPGSTPTKGNFIYLQSDQGDYIGQGENYTNTPENALITIDLNGTLLSVTIHGDDTWEGNFEATNSSEVMQLGFYNNTTEWPNNDPSRPALNWQGNGYGCGNVVGWFVVDLLELKDSALQVVSLRFQEHCNGSTAALHGMVRWNVSDPVTPPGPVYPPPKDLWKPANNVIPRNISFVYLESDPGDCIGEGRNYTYTPILQLPQNRGVEGLLKAEHVQRS